MGAVAFRVRTMLRATWRSTALLTTVVAVVMGAVLAIAAGAHRTSSVPDRYVAKYGGGVDAMVTQQHDEPRTASVAKLPSVESVESLTFFFGAIAPVGEVANRAEAGSVDVSTLAGSLAPAGSHLVAGRAPDPDAAEFVATQNFVDQVDGHAGETFHVDTLSVKQGQEQGFGADPGGASYDAVLVGIITGPDEVANGDSTSSAIFSPSVLRGKDTAVVLTLMSVHLRPGADLSSLRAELDTLPNRDLYSVQHYELIGDEIRAAVSAQSQGLWLVAAIAAIAALVVLGQIVLRQVRLSPDERRKLSAIGVTRRQVSTESLLRAVLPVVAGAILGAALSTLASDRFPTGFTRPLEPDPGRRIDLSLLAIGVAVGAIAVLLWVVVGLTIQRTRLGSRRSTGRWEALTRRCPPAVSTGLGFAFGGSSKSSGSARGPMGGLLVACALLAGALTFGMSLGRVIDEPTRFGDGSVIPTGTGGDQISPEVDRMIETDPAITGATRYATRTVRVGDATLNLVGMEPDRGHVLPTVLGGRLPSSTDEVVLGRLAASSLHTGVGRRLTVSSEHGTSELTVTGIVAVPSIEGGDGVGQDGVATLAALRRIVGDDVQPSTANITVRSNATDADEQRIVRTILGHDAPMPAPSVPAVISNVSRIRSTPYILAGVLVGLTTLIVAFVATTAARRRRRDLAVLRSLGADGRWVNRALHWQSTAVTLLPAVIGLPVGVIAGARIFRSFADSMGVSNDAAVPVATCLIVLFGALVLANLSGILAGLRDRRAAPGAVLRTE